MKAASLKEIQSELETLPKQELLALCLRLGRFKKENKELLTYLLFEAFDQEAYIALIKKEMKDQFEDMNRSNAYLVKKSLRKILRTIGKYGRYTGSATVEVQLLLYYCALIQAGGIRTSASAALENLYQNQLKKIRKLIGGMHEDLQFDYLKELEPLATEPNKITVVKKIISYIQNKKHAKIKDQETPS